MKLSFKVSITGILARVCFKDQGFTLAQIRKHYGFTIEEFCKNFELAKEASEKGDSELVKKFFEIYC